MKNTNTKQVIIGLTGPIASGKNEVCKILRRRGAYVIDADKIGHEVMRPQSDVWHALVKTFGSKILKPGGGINRRKLGEIVFGNPRLLKKLNKITHPAMKEEVIRESRKQKAVSSKLIIINAAVLKEIGFIPTVDQVWIVLAGKKKRLNRLVKKGLSREKALARIKAQKADREYLKIADVVIRNDFNIKKLKVKVLSLIPNP